MNLNIKKGIFNIKATLGSNLFELKSFYLDFIIDAENLHFTDGKER